MDEEEVVEAIIEEEPDKEVDMTVPKKKPKKSKVGKPKKFTITFKENRRFEMTVNREFYVFEGRQSITVDADFLDHPDFQNKRKYFSIKGI